MVVQQTDSDATMKLLTKRKDDIEAHFGNNFYKMRKQLEEKDEIIVELQETITKNDEELRQLRNEIYEIM